jgi:hypothetical protein
VRVDDWNEDSGDEPREDGTPPPAPRPAAAPQPAAPAGEAAPGPRPRPPLRVMLPIYLIGGISTGMICIMFLIVMILIASR